MLSIFLLAALIWWGGGFAGLDRRLRLSLLALIFLAVLAIQLTLPDGAPLSALAGAEEADFIVQQQ
ncbi:MAG: molybdopterin biosynthesis protein, partial [Phaeobacter italicus]